MLKYDPVCGRSWLKPRELTAVGVARVSGLRNVTESPYSIGEINEEIMGKGFHEF